MKGTGTGAEIQKGDFVPSSRDFVKLCKIIGTCTDESMGLNQCICGRSSVIVLLKTRVSLTLRAPLAPLVLLDTGRRRT